MSEQMQVTLRYQHGASRMLPDGRIEIDTLPYVIWACTCGQEVKSVNVYNGLFYTHCIVCNRPYSIDWRHGITPRVLLLSENRL